MASRATRSSKTQQPVGGNPDATASAAKEKSGGRNQQASQHAEGVEGTAVMMANAAAAAEEKEGGASSGRGAIGGGGCSPCPSPGSRRGRVAGSPGSAPASPNCRGCRLHEAKAMVAEVEMEELQARVDQLEGYGETQPHGELEDGRVEQPALEQECEDLHAQVGLLNQAIKDLKARSEESEEEWTRPRRPFRT